MEGTGAAGARVSVPVPVLAAALVIVAALALLNRARPRPVLHLDSTTVALEGDRRYETRLDASGFQPLPDGAVRVVKVEGVSQ